MRWQYGRTGEADRAKQRKALAAMGMSPEQIDAALPAKREEGPQLLPLALPVWLTWLDMDTQWRVSDGVIQGLDVCALDVVHRQRGTPRNEQRDMWPLLKAMEREALKALRDK